jgi:hypothetical protein
MSWFIYKFIGKNNNNEYYHVLKNKNINEIRYNIKNNRTQVPFINEGNHIINYDITLIKELNVKSKNDALIQFNNFINTINSSKKNIDENYENNQNNQNNKIKNSLIYIFDLIDKLDINDTTKQSYKNLTTTIFKIHNGDINNNITFDMIINDIDEFIKKLIKSYSNVSTQREIIVKLLRIAKLLDFDKNIIEKLTKIMYEYQDKHLDEQDKKRTQEINIQRDDLISKSLSLYNDNNISFMIYLILNIHIYYPKRDDYKNIKIIYDNFDENINDDNENLKILINKYNDYDGLYFKNNYTFVIINYKNAKSYGLDIFTIDDNNMKKIIDKSFVEYPDRDIFYHNEKNKAYKSVSNIFRKNLGISLNDIRKILTKEMGVYTAKTQLKHSANISRTYYKRK